MISFFQSRVVKIEQQLSLFYCVCSMHFSLSRGDFNNEKILVVVVVEWKKKKDDEKKQKKKKRRKIDSLRYNNCRDNNTKNTHAPLLW